MRVLIVGDVHGRHRELAAALRIVQSDFGIAAAIQVGDFGFYKEPMARLRQERLRFPVPVHVIDGNHEDHGWLWRALRTGAGRTWKETANLLYQPRPSVARLGASRIGFLGGALHVDRPQTRHPLSRLPNYILRHHREQATALFNRDQPELIVTHSCPAGIGLRVRGAPDLVPAISEHIRQAGFDPGPHDDCGETELRLLWRGLRYRPRGWVFGHFHCAHEARVEGTRFVGVGDDFDGRRGRLVLWDTEEKKLLTCRLS
jgi:predicted phosphodiesterase